MNWRRGLLRLWIVGSIFWIITIATITYFDIISPYIESIENNAMINECIKERKLDPSSGNYFDCFDAKTNNLFADIVAKHRVISYLLFAILPPFLVLALGVAVAWVATGFQKSR